MNIFLVSLLVVFGVALMVLELFLIPGFGIAGVCSLLSCAAGVVLAYMRISPMAGHLTLIAVFILLGLSILIFLRSRSLDKMALKTDITDRVDLTSGLDIKPGDKAVTISRLAPMGKILVDGHELEAKSTGDFVAQQQEVTVVRVEGNTIVVSA